MPLKTCNLLFLFYLSVLLWFAAVPAQAKDVPNIAILDSWRPQDWAYANNSDKLAMMQKLYDADILTDQYTRCDGAGFFDDLAEFLGLADSVCKQSGETPVLEVGRGFMKLSMQDKLRVVEYVDYVYEITSSHPDGMFVIIDDYTNDEIGLYTRRGLQLNK